MTWPEGAGGGGELNEDGGAGANRTLFPPRMVGMGRKGVSQAPTPSFEGLRVTFPRPAAGYPLATPSLRAATV